jgi:DMSO reductase iron-sulfur subunit
MINIRPEEQDYALLQKHDMSASGTSCHGNAIDLSKDNPELTGKSLNINGNDTISDNPDRYKQHGFHFTADNCIGCHACEVACQEKNDLPAHLAFRKVGVLEGGSYPDTSRINISMACNHCEDPVCLKGCPTRAYTKHAEYGAVLQDPDICFGCGYCTWVCPYNAPILDTVKGQVSKCNMCVDRLEEGLKPSCVAACLGNALDFGVVEDLPNNREQAKLNLPGFPDPSISRPNTRFQQIKSMPRDLHRMDSMPIHYQRDDATGEYKTKVEEDDREVAWGLNKLSSRENPLVVFTLLSQLAVGGLALLFILPLISSEAAAVFSIQAHPLTMPLTLIALCAAQAIGLFLSATHLGKPQYFYRGFNNLRHSWISREALAVAIFFGLLGAFSAGSSMPILHSLTGIDFPAIIGLDAAMVASLSNMAGWGGAIVGLASIFIMNMAYQIKARPSWNHWHTCAIFVVSSLTLGSLFLGLTFGIASYAAGYSISALLSLLAWPLLLGLVIQAVAQIAHLRYLTARGAEAAVSRFLMLSDFGKSYWARYISLAVLAIFAILFSAQGAGGGMTALLVWIVVLVVATLHEVVGRAMFYVLVIPTTMPGDFFWGNKGFEAHARKVGLTDMPQVGVLADSH